MPPFDRPEQQEGRSIILAHDVVVQRINKIIDHGLRLHEWLHDETQEEEVKKVLKNPAKRDLIQKRLNSFALFFSRMMPARALILHGRMSRGEVTPEMLEKMGLSPDAIRKLAGIEVQPGEAKEPIDITPGNGNGDGR